ETVARLPTVAVRSRLAELDDGASLFELLLRRLGFVLVHAFLDGLRRGLDEILRFLQTERRQLAHGLDDVDLVRTDFLQDDVELGLFLGGGGSAAGCRGASRGRGRNGDRSGRRDAEA